MASVSRCAHVAAHATAAAAAAAAVPRRATGMPTPSLLASSAAQRAPILDFLLPSFVSRSSRSYSTACARQPTSSQQPTPSPRRPARPLARSSCSSSSSFAAVPATAAHQTRRSFSATARRPKTQTLLNPQTDDDGNEMRLEITPRAAKRLAKVMAKDGNPRLALRIQVESGGCHGFQYLMSLVTLPEQLPGPDEAGGPGPDGEEPVIRDDDTIFVYAEDGEAPPTDLLSAPKIILDTPSLELLRGSKVDFTTELIGSQFKITDNPLATSSCGCGTSFDIKV